MKVMIVTGGTTTASFLINQNNNFLPDIIVGVDSGLNKLHEAGITPDVMIGDFDSVENESLNTYENKGVQKLSFPSQKDVTDTEIALEYVINQGAKDVILVGATGSRIDHMMSNIFLLSRFIKRANVAIVDPHNMARIYEGPDTIKVSKSEYDFISLQPITDTVEGVTTVNMKYPLNNATLYRDTSRGISNELICDKGEISFSKGLLLFVMSSD